MAKQIRQLIEEYYEVLWNEKKLDQAHKFLDPSLNFRGSLGMRVDSINGFCDYAKMLFSAFPNLYHVIEDIVIEGDKAAVRLVYTATHSGKLFGFEPTGNRIRYSGACFFKFENEKIVDAWVLGDLNALYGQLNVAEHH
ncbi:ester cyclase [Sulfurospirillum arsenophilum]|uniref:ester cyclase n=1 Tax=Sulfurospirillum arsenophilum TaxID=56698 RepID=UPI0005A7724E|nr:ester cyclase [Sulfurospirillum arsenophilum]